jgi:glycosyltransferase involved in cell wall biosynthesis
VIVYSPPLPLSFVGEKVKKLFGSRYLLNVQDLFPQNAIDLGILKNPLVIKLFEKIEERAYKNADVVTFHSEGNLQFTSNKYKNFVNKFRILHNWIDVSTFDGFKRSGVFRKKYGLNDKFLILFAGVMGPSQGLDFVIELAEIIRDLQEVCFLLVGDGIEKTKLEKKVKELSLNNVVFKPFVSKAEYPILVKDCDIGLVSLTSKNKTPVVPSKILGYMAAGIPILAFLNKESDGHKIIRDARCGYSCIWGNLEEAENLLRKMYKEKDKLLTLGINGYRYVKTHFNKDKIIDELLKMVGI